MFTFSLRAKFVAVSTSVGSTDDLPGRSSTSSKVRPSAIDRPSFHPHAKHWAYANSAIKQRSPAGPRWLADNFIKLKKCITVNLQF